MLRFKRGSIFISEDPRTESNCLHRHRTWTERSRCDRWTDEGIKICFVDYESCATCGWALVADEGPKHCDANQVLVCFGSSRSCSVIYSRHAPDRSKIWRHLRRDTGANLQRGPPNS